LVEHTTENRGVGGSIPPLTTHAPSLVLLCAPSMGILDNWLPVLHAAREQRPEWRIVALIPDRGTLAQLDPLDTAHVLADGIIDVTVAPLVDGSWIEVDGFLAATDAARARPILRSIPSRRQRSCRTSPAAFAGPRSRLLYDVRLHEKQRLRRILQSMGDTPRLSHNHGIELEVVDGTRVAPDDPDNVQAAFLYGASEISAYAQNFGLRPDVLHPVGIARHDPAWVPIVVERSRSLHVLPFDEFVFVVSRPAGSSYLPTDRKISALRALHQVFWEERGIPIVLRTHPKEREDGTLAAALPASEEGTSWATSRAHPFHLAEQSLIGVTFLSGVAVDLVTLGVPVIELLDVRGLTAHDRPDAARDAAGQVQFGPYRRDGLVIPAEDPGSLRSAVDGILADRRRATERLQARVRELFADPTDAPRSVLVRMFAE